MAADLSRVAVAATRLQNGYALAVNTRDWDYFRTLFTPDVLAAYPHGSFNGMEHWLGNFIPFHDTCGWTSHVITNHVVGEDDHGIWATCYGWVQWTLSDKPGFINRATVLFRDRLVGDGGTWRIARRKLNVLMDEIGVPLPAGVVMRPSIHDLADWS
jgi:SnoaL-like domain